jgi:hypothetical protein
MGRRGLAAGDQALGQPRRQVQDAPRRPLAAATEGQGRSGLGLEAPITQTAFDAIARTMPFGSVNFEAGVDANGERYIWLPRAVVDRLRSLRGPVESFSVVILRLAAEAG